MSTRVKDKDGKWHIVAGNTVSDVIRNPDWANAVAITSSQLLAGFVAPEDGIYAGFIYGAFGDTDILINNIPVSRGYNDDNEASYAQCQTSVNKGDIISATNQSGELKALLMHFVPYKVTAEYPRLHAVPVPTFMKTAPAGYLMCDGSPFDTGKYPILASIFTDGKMPDLRECVLVGAGQNATHSIAAHDVYNIGEFKDDQLQGHIHAVNSSFYVPDSGTQAKAGGATNAGGVIRASTIVEGRHGNVTHGKQIGINYIMLAE